MSSLVALQLTSSSSRCLQSTRRTRWVWPWVPGHDESVCWLKIRSDQIPQILPECSDDISCSRTYPSAVSSLVDSSLDTEGILHPSLLSSAQLLKIWSHSTAGSNKEGLSSSCWCTSSERELRGLWSAVWCRLCELNWTELNWKFCLIPPTVWNTVLTLTLKFANSPLRLAGLWVCI